MLADIYRHKSFEIQLPKKKSGKLCIVIYSSDNKSKQIEINVQVSRIK